MWGFVRNDRNVIKLSKEIWNSRRSSTSAVSNRNTAVSAATKLYSCCPQNTLSAHQNLYGATSTCQSHRLVRFVRTTDCLLTGFLHVVWMPLPRYRPLSWESKKTLSAQRRVVQNGSELWSDSMQTWETLMAKQWIGRCVVLAVKREALMAGLLHVQCYHSMETFVSNCLDLFMSKCNAA